MVTNRFKTVALYFSTWALLTFRARSFFVMEASSYYKMLSGVLDLDLLDVGAYSLHLA